MGPAPVNASAGYATITAAEYFVDTDPGEGSGTAFQPKDGAFDSEVESIVPKDLNVTGLSVGPHLVGVRYKDNNNTWGDVLYQTIHVYDANPSGSGSGGGGGGGSGGSSVGFATISAAEYFVDTDPGEGSGTAFQPKDGAFDSEVEAILPKDLNVTGLSVGPHLVGVRYKDNNNTWGDVLYQTIHVYDANPSGSGTGGSVGGGSGGSSVGFATITAAEYFVDTDPGEGSGTAFQPKDGAFDSEVESIVPKDLNVTGLSVGPHLVGVRYKDNNNIWGDVLYQTIHVYDANPDATGTGSGGSGGTGGFSIITGAEYFIGEDPGEGNATALQPKDGAFDSEVESTLAVNLSLDGYAIGSYLVGVRYKDNNGTWGDVLFKSVEVDVDTDGDGLADKAEAYYETNSTQADTDGDGYSDGEEVAFGSDPTDPNSLGNQPPTDLNSTAVLAFSENQPFGTIIGEFNATDPDGHAITYHFLNGENNNSLFSLERNGTLKTATTFDYESNASSYTITVQVKDELNATTEGNFTVTLLDDKSDNPPSDLWLSNAKVNENKAVGTEVAQVVPLDKKYAYQPGQGIGSHVVILRNASHMGVQFIKGEVLNVTLIGNGGTVNGVTIFRPQVNKGPTWLPLTGRGDWWQRVFPGVSLVLESGNEGVSLDGQTGMLSVNRIFDYEIDGTSHSFSVRAEREGMHGFNKSFTLAITDIFEDLDQDGTADHLDDDIDGDGFTNAEELAYGSDPFDPNSVANAAPVITLKDEYPEQVDKNGFFHIRSPENQKDIIQVTATDFDKDDLNFSIYGWQDLDNFEINASTGSLRFKYAPDFENPSDHDTNNKFGIVLRVSDGKVHHDQPVFIHVDNQNEPPFDLNTTISFRVLENQPAGTIVGKLTAKDQDEGDQLTYKLVRDRDPIANEFFSLDENGTLRTAEVLDFENNASLFIRAKATDKAGLLTKKGFVVEVINIAEDFDGDGTEDAYDEDIDGDGFSNEEEFAYGSDPLDSSSVINAPPSNITMKGGEVLENQPIGTLVARFFGVDADKNDSLIYQLVDLESVENFPFKLSLFGGLRTIRELGLRIERAQLHPYRSCARRKERVL